MTRAVATLFGVGLLRPAPGTWGSAVAVILGLGIDRLAGEIAQVVKMPEVIRTFDTAVIEAVGAGPADYAKVIARENELMARAAKVADLKPE